MITNEIISRLKDSVCICFVENQLTIGVVDYSDDQYNILILKDARLIIPNELEQQNKLDLSTIIRSCSSIEAFKKFCAAMTTPIEYLILKNPSHALVVSKEIKQFYKDATNVDKTIIKNNNSSNSPKKKNYDTIVNNLNYSNPMHPLHDVLY